MAAFTFQYVPSNTGASTQAGMQSNALALQRQKQDFEQGVQQQSVDRQNAFRDILRQSTDPNTGQINYQNAFKSLNQAGLTPEALKLDETVKKTENSQNLLGTMTAALVRDPSDQNITSAGQYFKASTGQDHPVFNQLVSMPVDSRRQLLIAAANSMPSGQKALTEMYPEVSRETTDFNGGAQVVTKTKQPLAGMFGGNAAPAPMRQNPNPGAQVNGEDFLKGLNPNTAAQVKALSEGRMQFPAGFALKSPYLQNMISMVAQYDPQFDAVNYGSRAKTRASFVGGKDAENMAAINTAIAHIQNLADNYDKLGNSPIPAYNSVTNFLGQQLGNEKLQKNLGSVSADAEAVAHELAKVFRSTGMSEGEINAWKEKISTNAPPGSQKAVIDSALELMNGRLEALADKYNKGMGTTKQGLEFLSPKSQDIVNNLKARTSGNPVSKSSQPSKSLNPQTGQPFRVGDMVKGGDGGTYVIKSLSPDGDHDVERVQ